MLKVYTHLNELVTLQGASTKDGRNLLPEDLSIIKDAAIVFDENKIIWTGKSEILPDEYKGQAINMVGHVLTPEIVDSHTHIVFGGDRAQEYTDRLNGVSYEEIARRGGGILSTMKHTNEATSEQLFEMGCERIKSLNSYGVGTIEIKSGYGLSYEKEFELALVIDRLKKKFSPNIKIFNTFLAAHDVPKNYSTSREYLNKVVIPLLEKLGPMKIIDAVDIFHEKNYFDSDDVSLLFNKAKELGIHRKIHADELNDNGGAALAVQFEALSADHLLKISSKGIQNISKSKTVATLLPGTAFFLGKPLAPARLILDSGAKVAIASDYNPGSCHCDNLLLIASMASAQMKINQAELWAGITMNAAAALGLYQQGFLSPGQQSRFSLFKVESLAHITYNWGKNFSVSLT
jgi:imidazolonepropionase